MLKVSFFTEKIFAWVYSNVSAFSFMICISFMHFLSCGSLHKWPHYSWSNYSPSVWCVSAAPPLRRCMLSPPFVSLTACSGQGNAGEVMLRAALSCNSASCHGNEPRLASWMMRSYGPDTWWPQPIASFHLTWQLAIVHEWAQQRP